MSESKRQPEAKSRSIERLLGWALICAFGVIIARLWYVQVVWGPSPEGVTAQRAAGKDGVVGPKTKRALRKIKNFVQDR